MSARRYAIKNNKTNKFLVQIQRDWTKEKYTYTPKWADKLIPEHCRRIGSLNDLIEEVIDGGIQAILDDCEIETLEIRYVPIKSSVNMKNYRKRHEQIALVNRLKGYR